MDKCSAILKQIADLAAEIQYDDFSEVRDMKYNDPQCRRNLLQTGLTTELNAAGQTSNLANSALSQDLQIPQLPADLG